MPELDSQTLKDIEQNLILTYEGLSSRTLAEADPIRLFLQSIALLVFNLKMLNAYYRDQSFITLAEGHYLDNLGTFTNTPRLPAAAAHVTVEFSLSAPRNEITLIPKGTRVTPDGRLFFATVADGLVPAHTLTLAVECICLEIGAIGNGWLAGQINKLVDPLPWIRAVNNITISAGGADSESDGAYRTRLLLAPEKFSTAGAVESYRYWARTASALIGDVAVISPDRGEVQVLPLLADGSIPPQEILDAVSEALSDRTVRPLTDHVEVLPPDAVTYSIEGTYWIASEYAGRLSEVQASIADAAQEYVEWQRQRLGRAINPSELISRLVRPTSGLPGASRVTITSPTFQELSSTEVAQLSGSIQLQFGGLDHGG